MSSCSVVKLFLFLLLPCLLTAGDLKGKITVQGDGAVVAVQGMRPQQIKGNFKLPKEDFVIDQKNMRFVPAILPVSVGSTVNFPNSEEAIYHHVWSPSPGNSFDLGTYQVGQTRSVTFNTPGIVEILCNIHTRMYAAVIVLDNPYFITADKEGKYEIQKIPSGEYEVKVYICKNQEVITKSARVTVPEEGEVELNLGE